MKQLTLMLLLIALIYGCTQQNNKSLPEIIPIEIDTFESMIYQTSNNTAMTLPDCSWTFVSADTGNYSLSFGYWQDTTVTYWIGEGPKGHEQRFKDGICDGLTMWEEDTGLIFVEVNDSATANISFEIGKLDNLLGGVLAEAEFPPFTEYSSQYIKTVFDSIDASYKGFNFTSIAAHEIGHNLGLKHSVLKNALMYRGYSIHDSLNIDDKLGARVKYQRTDSFKNGKHTFIWINKDNRSKIHPNFRLNEFYTKCEYNEWREGHFIDSILISAAIIIREYTGTPFKVISTYRHYDCNDIAGGKSQSKHMRAIAMDFKTSRSGHDKILRDYLTNGPLYQKLVDIGVRGFGVYSTSFHIDTRFNPKNSSKIYKWGWNSSGYNDEALEYECMD